MIAWDSSFVDEPPNRVSCSESIFDKYYRHALLQGTYHGDINTNFTIIYSYTKCSALSSCQ